MKQLNRSLYVAMTLLLVSISGFSMSLGSSSGAVVFGRPLDLTIQARLDGPLEESSNCFSAEIFQGDARFDSNRVRVDVKATANPLEAVIRIRSTASITEPWAKVILRSNCGTKISRQYDFLTDFVSDLPSSLPNARLPVVASTAIEAQESAAILPSLAPLTATAAGKALSAKSAAVKQKSARTATVNETRPVAATVKNADDRTALASNLSALRPSALISTRKLTAKTTPVAEGKSRLKMETFDLADERQVMLKMSTALLAPVVSDTPANAQALAQAKAVWRALNAKPEDVAADAQKLQATAAELQSVKSTALKEQTSLQARLQEAEKKKFANPLVYGLLAVLVLTLAGLAWMWLRIRKNAQADYAWLDAATFSPDTQSQSNLEAAEPTFVNTVNTAPAQRPYREEKPTPAFATRAEETVADVQADSEQESLSTPIVFTKPAPKVEVHVDNNPLWPADAASATHTDIPEALVITPTEAFLLPITQPEPELQATVPYPPVIQETPIDIQLPQQKVIAPKVLVPKVIAPPESLNIDLDFSKISPPKVRGAVSAKKNHAANHIEFYSDGEHAKAGLAEPHTEQVLASEQQPKSPPPLPKLRKPAAPVTTDHKSNLIDFESFAATPPPQRPSRFTG